MNLNLPECKGTSIGIAVNSEDDPSQIKNLITSIFRIKQYLYVYIRVLAGDRYLFGVRISLAYLVSKYTKVQILH